MISVQKLRMVLSTALDWLGAIVGFAVGGVIALSMIGGFVGWLVSDTPEMIEFKRISAPPTDTYAIRRFLESHPDTRFRRQVSELLDDAAWAAARNEERRKSRDELMLAEEYLSEYPTGRHAQEAKSLRFKLKSKALEASIAALKAGEFAPVWRIESIFHDTFVLERLAHQMTLRVPFGLEASTVRDVSAQALVDYAKKYREPAKAKEALRYVTSGRVHDEALLIGIDNSDWELAKSTDTADAYAEYGRQHPKGLWYDESKGLFNYHLHFKDLGPTRRSLETARVASTDHPSALLTRLKESRSPIAIGEQLSKYHASEVPAYQGCLENEEYRSVAVVLDWISGKYDGVRDEVIFGFARSDFAVSKAQFSKFVAAIDDRAARLALRVSVARMHPEILSAVELQNFARIALMYRTQFVAGRQKPLVAKQFDAHFEALGSGVWQQHADAFPSLLGKCSGIPLFFISETEKKLTLDRVRPITADTMFYEFWHRRTEEGTASQVAAVFDEYLRLVQAAALTSSSKVSTDFPKDDGKPPVEAKP
jgi:hypothetical protein